MFSVFHKSYEAHGIEISISDAEEFHRTRAVEPIDSP